MADPTDEAPTFDETVHPGLAAAISMQPIVDRLAGTLETGDVPCAAAGAVLTALTEAYIAGVRDGARDTVAQIATEAAARGLHIRLAPELLADDARADGG